MSAHLLFRRTVGTLISLLVASASASASPGNLDPAFGTVVSGGTSGTVRVIERQTDGKILIAGSFSEINGRLSSGIARLNPDGSIDTSFNPPEFVDSLGSAGSIVAMAIQSDGKIIVAGLYSSVAGDSSGPGLRRLNTDGTLDTSFNIYPIPGGDTIRDLAVQADDRILVGGSSSNVGGALVRLNADGSVDNSFSGPADLGSVFDILIQADGKLVVGTPATAKRLNQDGTLDASFAHVQTNNGSIQALAGRPDGKILIGGVFTSLNGISTRGLGLLNSDGTPDHSFNQGNTGAVGAVFDIELLSNGKILIGGSFDMYNRIDRLRVARLNPDGTIDLTLVNNPALEPARVNDLLPMADGRILVGSSQVSARPGALLLNSDGTTNLEYLISFGGRVRRVVNLASGKIVIAGQFNFVNGVPRKSLARLNADGTLDTSFVPYFNSQPGELNLNSVLEQADGKLVVAGSSGFRVQRLNVDGSQDVGFVTPFTTASTPFDLAIQPDGKVIVVGVLPDDTGAPPRRIARLLTNGQIDPIFANPVPNDNIYCVVRMPDRRLLIGGDFTNLGGVPRERIARLNGDGNLDTTFDTSSGASGSVFAIAFQPDGKVVVGGTFGSLAGSNAALRIGRLNSDGSRDTTFAQSIDNNVVTLALQADGKILVGGSFDHVGGVLRDSIARLNPNGTLDPGFAPSAVYPVLDLKSLPNGKTLVGGEFIRISGRPAPRIARLFGSSAPFDFDGDGRSDISVYRPSSGTWFELLSGNSSFDQVTFGLSGDIPAPADYDGDGKTDEAVFRPSTGEFWYLRSSDGVGTNKQWGQAGDIPRPSDFDGDGIADFVVYRPSNSVWYRRGSSGQISITQFGIAGDQPLVGDFDGDGRSDLAVFRPSTGDWWHAPSSGIGSGFANWGQSGDIAAPADFDGDGKTDVAVFRPSNGIWYVLRSSDQSPAFASFGLAGDRPVPADYDGDGRADVAVFRPSNGSWYVMQTTGGFMGTQWGISTDIAVPASMVPE